MFGNEIPIPTGFTQRFINNYTTAIGSAPSNNVAGGGVGDDSKTGKGIATGVGIEFNDNADKHLINGACRDWSFIGTIMAGAEINLALMQQNGCLGINGYRASGHLGLYGNVAASIKGVGRNGCDTKTKSLFIVSGGAWLSGSFPNPEYLAGALDVNIDLFEGLIKERYWQNFEMGTYCAGTAVVIANAGQQDKANDYKNKLIQYVAPNTRYNFPISSTINAKYSLVPNEVFDIAENQGDGNIKNRTFKLVVNTSLVVKNTSTNSWNAKTLRNKINTLGEYQYYIFALTNTTLNLSNPQIANILHTNLNTNNGNAFVAFNGMFQLAYITTPLPTPVPIYPNPVPNPSNYLEVDKDYKFVVTATLMEYGMNVVTGLNAGRGNGMALSWAPAKTRLGVVISETKTLNFRTGSQPILNSSNTLQRTR